MPKKNRIEIFEKRLKELADDYGGNTKLADVTGLNRQTFGFYINGKRTPDCSILAQIARSTGVSANWLLGLSDVKELDELKEAVTVYMDLKPESVKVYSGWKERHSKFTRIINLILQDKHFDEFVEATLKLYAFRMQCLPEQLEGRGGITTGLISEALQFKATELFSLIMDELGWVTRNKERAERHQSKIG